MNENDFNKVVEFYEKTIMQGIIRPLEINEIYSIIHPEVENPMGMAYKLKQRAIAVFVGTRKAQMLKSFEDFLKTFDTTDISIPDNPSIRIENPSHSEKVYPYTMMVDGKEVTVHGKVTATLMPDDSIEIELPLSHSEEDVTSSLSVMELNSETDTQEVTQVLDNETPHRSGSDTQEVTDTEVQIALLEADYENAVDANEKRSLKTKIRHLKNKANG